MTTRQLLDGTLGVIACIKMFANLNPGGPLCEPKCDEWVPVPMGCCDACVQASVYVRAHTSIETASLQGKMLDASTKTGP